MIVLKTSRELELMKRAGAIAAQALQVGLLAVKPGITTLEVNRKIHETITAHGATPSFLGYNGFPAAACISVNDEIIHGIPGSKVIQEGDIVSIDVGAFYQGFHGDNAATVGAGTVSKEAQQLMDVTAEALKRGIAAAGPGGRIGDISAAVQTYAEQFGYGVVRQFVGHGVGAKLHESPEVPNFGIAGRGPRLAAGMTIAIEPMINQGSAGIRILDDEWTVVTTDKKLSAHFEHTIAITNNGAVVLTQP